MSNNQDLVRSIDALSRSIAMPPSIPLRKSSGGSGATVLSLGSGKVIVGYFTVNLSATSAAGGSCTFPTGSFSSPPIVVANLAGVSPGASESGGAAAETCTMYSITSTGFQVWVRNTAGAVITTTFAVQYIAVGV